MHLEELRKYIKNSKEEMRSFQGQTPMGGNDARRLSGALRALKECLLVIRKELNTLEFSEPKQQNACSHVAQKIDALLTLLSQKALPQVQAFDSIILVQSPYRHEKLLEINETLELVTDYCRRLLERYQKFLDLLEE